MIFIFAGNIDEARQCRMDLGLSRENSKLISSTEKLRGMRSTFAQPHLVILYGTFHRNTNNYELKDLLFGDRLDVISYEDLMAMNSITSYLKKYYPSLSKSSSLGENSKWIYEFEAIPEKRSADKNSSLTYMDLSSFQFICSLCRKPVQGIYQEEDFMFNEKIIIFKCHGREDIRRFSNKKLRYSSTDLIEESLRAFPPFEADRRLLEEDGRKGMRVDFSSMKKKKSLKRNIDL